MDTELLKIVEEIIKDTALAVQQSTKKEHSGLIGELRDSITVLQQNHLAVIETLQRIEAQTIKTNGRVSNLENWKANSKGIISGFGVAVMMIIGLVVYVFNVQVNHLVAQEQDTKLLIEKHITK